ncbi:MAG: HigA family addiction module antitoxin [Ignavibacteriales bacterium]|nr:HigA family addiction module antitoxin [Ignavibacteriales bacterium]
MSYLPNKAIHPGRIIAEELSREGMTQKSLCERMGITEKHLSQIINGEASITVETSLLLENALGGSASFWINLEKNFQETKVRIEKLSIIKEEISILSKYPYLELVKRRYVEQTTNKEKRIENLWKFFGVNSLSFVSTTEGVAFRKRNEASIKSESIAAWLRCGELEAKKQILPEYSETKLRDILSTLKLLSTKKPEQYSVEVIKQLNEVGIALIYISHFPGSGVSGAVRWINNKPVIQLSLYYSWADIFWFNLYHELGHLVLHGKKEKFIEFDKKELALARDKEDEADEFASDELISPKSYSQFLKNNPIISKSSILEFANSLKIHPGIVAGRLCHDKKVNWNTVSSLRPRLKIASE